MKTLITEFISLDGVVQAPGGPDEDTDGGFSHGGWSMKYFDPVAMGGMYAELAAKSDARKDVEPMKSRQRHGPVAQGTRSLIGSMASRSTWSPTR